VEKRPPTGKGPPFHNWQTEEIIKEDVVETVNNALWDPYLNLSVRFHMGGKGGRWGR